MAADTTDTALPTDTAERALEEKLAAWEKVQKTATETYPDLKDSILSIRTKDEWIRFITDHPKLKGLENAYMSLDEYKLPPTLAQQAPEASQIAVGTPLHYGSARGRLLASHETMRESSHNSPSSTVKNVAQKLNSLADPRALALGHTTPHLSFLHRVVNSVKNAIMHPFKSLHSAVNVVKGVITHPIQLWKVGSQAIRLGRSVWTFVKEARAAQLAGRTLVKPLARFIGREIWERSFLGRTVNFFKNAFKLIKNFRQIPSMIRNVASTVRNVAGRIWDGLQNLWNSVFGGGEAAAEAGGEAAAEAAGATASTSATASAATTGAADATAASAATTGAADATAAGAATAEAADATAAGAATAEATGSSLLATIGSVAGPAIVLAGFVFWFGALLYTIAQTPNSTIALDPYAFAAQCGYVFPNITTANILSELQKQEAIVGIDTTVGSDTTYQADNGTESPYKSEEAVLFNTICLLYGRTPDKYNGQRVGSPVDGSQPHADYVSSFGKLFLGTTDVLKSTGEGNTVHLDFKEDPSLNCTINDIKKRLSSGQTFDLQIYNPDQCPSDVINSQMRFLIARNFALALYYRVKNGYPSGLVSPISDDLKKRINTFDNLFNQNKNNLLPTANCMQYQTPDECFADMVGEYLVFPYYIDSAPIPTSDPSECDPTQNPHIHCPSPTPTPTGPPKSFADEFTGGKYKMYYDYAKTNLFDGVDFFTPQLGQSVIDKAKYITDNLHTTCWDPSNPTVETGDMYDKLWPNPLQNPPPTPPVTYVIQSDHVQRAYCNEDGRYWCTYLVFDSYNLAANGKQLVPQTLGRVDNMVDYWKTKAADPNSGFIFLDISDATSDNQRIALTKDVQPGFAVFYKDPGKDQFGNPFIYAHTGIVSEVDINSNGDGIIHTLEANAYTDKSTGKPGGQIAVSHWIVQSGSDALGSSIDFGGIIKY